MKRIFIGGCPRSGTGAIRRLLTIDGRALITGEKGEDAWKEAVATKSKSERSKLVYVGDKMPEGYLNRAEELYKQFKNAKFIFTNRNGYGVIASYIRRPLRRHKPEDITEEILVKNIKFAENIWMDSYKKLKNIPDVLPEDKYIILKYEDNCNDIINMLVKLAEFLEYDTPVRNKMFVKKGETLFVYRPIHLDWVKGIEFWKEIILSTVSDEFKNLIKEYEEVINGDNQSQRGKKSR
jgi:hypothetical protein